jgi:hypothetical protein
MNDTDESIELLEEVINDLREENENLKISIGEANKTIALLNKKINDSKMYLRDNFAGMALQGVINILISIPDHDGLYDNFSDLAYKVADAMMKAREIKNERT